jgi:excisionase family DNA binding protein
VTEGQGDPGPSWPTYGRTGTSAHDERRGSGGRLELVRRVQRGDQIRPRLLGVEDAARYLSTSDKHVRSLIANGELPFIQRVGGGRYRLDIGELDAWAERNKQRT